MVEWARSRRFAIGAEFVLLQGHRLAPADGISVLDEQAAAFHAERRAEAREACSQPRQESADRHLPPAFVDLDLESSATDT